MESTTKPEASSTFTSFTDEITKRTNEKNRLKEEIGTRTINSQEKFELKEKEYFQIKTGNSYRFGYNFVNTDQNNNQRYEVVFDMDFNKFFEYIANRKGVSSKSLAQTFYTTLVEKFKNLENEKKKYGPTQYKKTRLLIIPKLGEMDFLQMLKNTYSGGLNLTTIGEISAEMKPPRLSVYNLKSGKKDSLKIGFAWENSASAKSSKRRLIIPGLDENRWPKCC